MIININNVISIKLIYKYPNLEHKKDDPYVIERLNPKFYLVEDGKLYNKPRVCIHTNSQHNSYETIYFNCNHDLDIWRDNILLEYPNLIKM